MKEMNLITQKIVAMLTVFVMLLAQSAVVGITTVSYAIDMLATNSNNVEFKAYFETQNNERTEETDRVDSKIDAKDLKLKIDVAVQNEGYFNGQISLENAGFRIKGAEKSNYIKKVENNVIYLEQINAEELAKIQVEIEFLEDAQFPVTALNSPTKVKLKGTYFNSKKNVDIDGTSEVTVNWVLPDNAKSELNSKLLTNKIYKVGEENKRVVQLLVQSRLEKNSYPVKNTQIEMNVPEGVEKVTVHKRTTNATNGNREFKEENYKLEENKLTISVNNDEENGQIRWVKNVQDVFVVTYQFPEDVNVANNNIEVNGKITTYAQNEINAEKKVVSLKEELDGIVTINQVANEQEIYKGKIYSGEERDYTTYARAYIDYVDTVDSVEIMENKASIENVQYKAVRFNKENISSILGDTWSINIQAGEEQVITN